MEWYEIVAMFFALIALLSLCGCLFYISYLDYKMKDKRLNFEKEKYDDLHLSLNCIYDELHKLNEKE